MQQLVVSYAQNREDLILAGFFGDVKKGFYIDIGANHPILHSVTKLFYKQGWRGIHIEPNESLCAMLRFDRPTDTVLNLGVSNETGSLPFTEYANHGLSTFSEEMRRSYAHQRSAFTDTFRRYDVPVRRLADIFAEQKPPHIHFMKVDVEGYEYEVLEGNDWKKYRPEMICIEANHIVKDWRPLLAKQGYTKVFNDGLNDYYLAKESQARAKRFSYAKMMLESGEIITQAVADKLRVTEQDQTLALHRLDNLNRQKIRAEWQANWYEHAPLKWMLQKFLRALDAALIRRLEGHPTEANIEYTDVKLAAIDKPDKAALQKLAASYAGSVRVVRPHPHPAKDGLRQVVFLGYRVVRKAARLLVGKGRG